MMSIKTTEVLVLDCLQKNVKTRKDDFILYGSVLKRMNLDLTRSIAYFLTNHKELKLPPFATVIRCRRKLQNKYPELNDIEMSNIRQDEEEKFINYAREK